MSDAAQPAPTSATKTSKLPVVALVLSIFPCTAWLGLILGVIAVVRVSKIPGSPGKGLALAAIVIPLVMGPLTMAVAWPNYMRFGCRAKAAEARANLKALHASQMSHRLDSNTYSTDLAAIKFTTSDNVVVRYDYRVIEASADRFVAEAVAKDATLKDDRWTIDEAGEPRHVVDGCR